jgi:hypothetical protein
MSETRDIDERIAALKKFIERMRAGHRKSAIADRRSRRALAREHARNMRVRKAVTRSIGATDRRLKALLTRTNVRERRIHL